MIPQDLHIHTTFSWSDDSVVPEQTVDLIASLKHARIVGISDHFECLADGAFEAYARQVRQADLKLGVEVNGHAWVDQAAGHDVDYFLFHCRDDDADYQALETLLNAGKPVIIAHPNILNTNLSRVPPECLVEINNRYVWRTDWVKYYGPYKTQFKFIISSDAHQPNWLSQTVARHAARQLGIEEHILF